MSTAEMKFLADMIRETKWILFLVLGEFRRFNEFGSAFSYERVPHYRDLTPQEEWDLLERFK